MLSIKRPTSTTVLYTVSTRSAHRTVTARAASLALLLVRVLAGLSILLLLWTEYRQATPRGTAKTGVYARADNSVLASPVGLVATWATERLHWGYQAVLIGGVSWMVFTKSHVEESLLVIRGLGVQTSTSSPSYLWTSSTRFIPTSNIQEIVIHEAFKGFEVKYYLSIVVEGEGDVVVVFPNILPRREILEQVWRGARACLYEPKG